MNIDHLLIVSTTTRTKKKRTIVLTGVIIFVVFIGISSVIYAVYHQVSSPLSPLNNEVAKVSIAPVQTPQNTPSLVPSHLNGVLVTAGNENLHPFAVMIENHVQARPQSGLGEADLVYEAIAEGGITRFMAIYGNAQIPVKVGPIRSARPYYVDFATELDAIYAHAGGSQDALNQISSTNLLDINGLTVGEPLFKRDLSRNVDLEHTLYSSTDGLWKYGTITKGWSQTGQYASWLFKDAATTASRAPSQTISVSVSDPLYSVKWTYDPNINSYFRFLAGQPHSDANTGKQIQVKNIVLETVTRSDYTETYGSIQKTVEKLTLTGTGPAVVFQNGIASKGTWQKIGTDRTRYFDGSGKEISFVRGPIWVHLVHPDSTITY